MYILALRTRQDHSRSGVLKKGRAAVGCRERVYKKMPCGLIFLMIARQRGRPGFKARLHHLIKYSLGWPYETSHN